MAIVAESRGESGGERDERRRDMAVRRHRQADDDFAFTSRIAVELRSRLPNLAPADAQRLAFKHIYFERERAAGDAVRPIYSQYVGAKFAEMRQSDVSVINGDGVWMRTLTHLFLPQGTNASPVTINDIVIVAAAAASTRIAGGVKVPGLTPQPAPRQTLASKANRSLLPESYINKRFTVDMSNAPDGSATNAAGYARNAPWFWRQMLSDHPEMFSPGNARAIRERSAPIIDETWVKYNKTHQSFLGDTLIHHHIDQGHLATGLPQSVHRAWHRLLHPER